jgi:hypothetical protein
MRKQEVYYIHQSGMDYKRETEYNLEYVGCADRAQLTITERTYGYMEECEEKESEENTYEIEVKEDILSVRIYEENGGVKLYIQGMEEPLTLDLVNYWNLEEELGFAFENKNVEVFIDHSISVM